MISRFKKLVNVSDTIKVKVPVDEYSYGEVIGDMYVVLEMNCGETTAILEQVVEISEVTPFKDSFGEIICVGDKLIVYFGNTILQKEVKVYFDEHYGMYKVRRLDGKFIDIENLASWINYSKKHDYDSEENNKNTVLIKLEL